MSNTAPAATMDHQAIIKQFEDGIYSDSDDESLEAQNSKHDGNNVLALLEDFDADHRPMSSTLVTVGINQALTNPNAPSSMNLEGSHKFMNPNESKITRDEDKVTSALKNNNNEKLISAMLSSISADQRNKMDIGGNHVLSNPNDTPDKQVEHKATDAIMNDNTEKLANERNTGNHVHVHRAESDKSPRELVTITKKLSATDVGTNTKAIILISTSVEEHILHHLNDDQRTCLNTHGGTLNVKLLDEDEDYEHNLVLKSRQYKKNSYELKEKWVDVVKKRSLKEGDAVGFYWNTINPAQPRISFTVIEQKSTASKSPERNTDNVPVHRAESDKSPRELVRITKKLTATDVGTNAKAITLIPTSFEEHILHHLNDDQRTSLLNTHGGTLNVKLQDEDEHGEYNLVLKRRQYKCISYELREKWFDVVKKRSLKEGDTVGFYWNTINPAQPRISFTVIERKSTAPESPK